MIDRSYLPFQSAREHQDRGMMKWMGFFLSEHTKFTLLNQLYLGQLLGNFQIKDQGRRCRINGYVVDLDFDQVTIKSFKQYKGIRTKDILEISFGGENIDEEERNL